jgi:hypothetical protein
MLDSMQGRRSHVVSAIFVLALSALVIGSAGCGDQHHAEHQASGPRYVLIFQRSRFDSGRRAIVECRAAKSASGGLCSAVRHLLAGHADHRHPGACAARWFGPQELLVTGTGASGTQRSVSLSRRNACDETRWWQAAILWHYAEHRGVQQ